MDKKGTQTTSGLVEGLGVLGFQEVSEKKELESEQLAENKQTTDRTSVGE